MNNEANQFENFKYSQEIKELLNINLSNDDLNNLDHIYNYYDSQNIQRDYEDLIEDIYIFIFKKESLVLHNWQRSIKLIKESLNAG